MYEDKIKWIEYKGKKILYTNFSGLSTDELTEFFDEINKLVTKEPHNSVLYITDVSSFKFNIKSLSIFNKNVEKTKSFDKGSAVIGTVGLIKIMYDAYSKIFSNPIKAFDSREEALEWLIKL